MKTLLRPFLAAFLVIASAVPLCSAEEPAAKPPPPVSALEQKFRDGLYAEEAKQDLDAARLAYQEIIAAFDRDRETAASALFRLGEIHRKQNRLDAARHCFRRVAREFPDREPLARLARENLKALGETLPEVPGAATPAPLSADPEQEKALARLKDLEKSSPDLILNPKTSLKTNGCISFDEAIEAGYVRVVEWLLDHGASADKTPSDASPLALAASFGHVALIELLLARQADLEARESPDRPLTAAATNGHLNVVRLLVEKGASVDETKKKPVYRKGTWTTSPLSAAIESGHRAIVEFLLAKGASPNINEGAALRTAVDDGNLSLVRLLLSAKADPNLPKLTLRREGRSGNVTQLSSGHEDLNQAGRAPKQASPGSPVNFVEGMGVIFDLPEEYRGFGQWRSEGRQGEDQFGMLHLAAIHGDTEVLSLLLDHKMEVDAKTPLGSTALELACMLGKQDVAGLLLKAGASVDHIAPGGLRLVDFILDRRDLKFYDLLREAGARVAGRSPDGVSALAAIGSNGTSRLQGDKDYVKWTDRLLNDGADPNGDDNFRPVNFAAYLNNLELIQLLKAKGADFTPDNSDAPLSVLVRAGVNSSQLPMIKELIAGGADPGARPARAEKFTSPDSGKLNFLETVAKWVPEPALLEQVLALKPPPGESFAVLQGIYATAKNVLDSESVSNGDRRVIPGNSSQLSKEEREALMNRAPAILQRLWDYQRLEWNPQLGSRVWYQTSEPRFSLVKLTFRYAGPDKASVNVVEALAYVFGQGALMRNSSDSAIIMQNGALFLPDFSRLTILRCDVATGKVLRREPVDLTALAGKGESAELPVLNPGDILDTIPGEKPEYSWRNFPEPLRAFFAAALPARTVTVKAGSWTRTFKINPWIYGFRWDPSTDLLAVEPTLSSVMRFLPKPAFFYRMEALRLTPKGKEPLTLDATKPGLSTILREGDEISVDAIPEDDPALKTRFGQGIFISREADGFIREVFHDPEARPIALEWNTAMDQQVVVRFCLDSESILPWMDFPNRKIVAAAATPWGGRLEIPRLKESNDEEWKPDTGTPSSGSEAFKLDFIIGKSAAISFPFYYQGVLFKRTPDGWSTYKHPDSRCAMSRTLEDAVQIVTSPGNKPGFRPAPWHSWELHRKNRDAPLAVFTPGKDALPLIFLEDGDSIHLSPEDAAQAVPPAKPDKRPDGKIWWSYENAGLEKGRAPQVLQGSGTVQPPRRRVVLPTQE